MAPETLEDCARETGELRVKFLMDIETAGIEALAEQHYLLALNALEQAERFFKVAHVHQMRALVRQR